MRTKLFYVNFNFFKMKFGLEMYTRYALTLNDLSIEDEHLILAFENDETPEFLASWYEEKYNLERL